MPDTWLERDEYLIRTNSPKALGCFVEMARIEALRHLLSKYGKHLEKRWASRTAEAKARYAQREVERIAGHADSLFSAYIPLAYVEESTK